MRSLSQPGKLHPFPSAPLPFSGIIGVEGTPVLPCTLGLLGMGGGGS